MMPTGIIRGCHCGFILVSPLYGVFSYCNGLREVCEDMLACEGKLSHLGLDKAPARSILSDANNNRN